MGIKKMNFSEDSYFYINNILELNFKKNNHFPVLAVHPIDITNNLESIWKHFKDF